MHRWPGSSGSSRRPTARAAPDPVGPQPFQRCGDPGGARCAHRHHRAPGRSLPDRLAPHPGGGRRPPARGGRSGHRRRQVHDVIMEVPGMTSARTPHPPVGGPGSCWRASPLAASWRSPLRELVVRPPPRPRRLPRKLTGSITVSAASSLTKAFTQLATTFKSAHPGRPSRSTSVRRARWPPRSNRAPADVFASASPATWRPSEAGDIDGTPVIFARNSLEIVVKPGNPSASTPWPT